MPAPISTAVTRPSSGALSLSGYQAVSGKKPAKPASSGALSLAGFQSATGQKPSVIAPIKGAVSSAATKSTPAAKTSSAPASSGAGTYWGTQIDTSGDVAAQVKAIDAKRKGLAQPGSSTGSPVPTISPAKAPTFEAPKKGLFESVVGSLATPKADPMAERAAAEYAKAIERKLAFERSVADTRRGVYSDDTSARVMQGRDQALQVANAETRAALQGAVQEQQAGIGFGQMQQSLNQAALGAAAGFAAPSPAGYGQTVFDPVTGSYSGGGGGLDPQAVASQLAQKVTSGQMTYEQAAQSLGYAGGAGTQFLNAAIQAINPNANIPAMSSQVGANQANYGTFAQQEATLQQATSRADQLGANLISTLRQYAGSDTARPIKEIENLLRDKAGDATATAFSTALAEAQRAYGALIQAGGNFTPTGTESTADALLSKDMTGDQLIASLEQLSQAGKITLQTVTNAKNSAFGSQQQNAGGAAPAGGLTWDSI